MKQRRSIVGKNNPMYGVHLFGEANPFYGKIHTQEAKQKMSLAKKGKPSGRLDFCHTEESKRKMSEAHKGLIPWNKGNGWCRQFFATQARDTWEEYWYERIPDGYVIHHLDGDIKNNHIRNLAMLTRSAHIGLHRLEE